MIEQFDVVVPAPGGRQKRNATVYLPIDYDGTTRFPVLYMFDGQTAFFDESAPFGDSLRMGEILDKYKAKIIVAAVDCDKVDRLTEYSPFPFSHDTVSSEGKGDVYLRWLVEDFKPMIDGRYSTLSDRENTFIAGSSMGGLMTVYALCRYRTVFAGGAALSPSFWVDPRASKEMIASAELSDQTCLYLDYGEDELYKFGMEQREILMPCLDELLRKKVELTFRLIRGGTHSETSWRNQAPAFLRTLKLI